MSCWLLYACEDSFSSVWDLLPCDGDRVFRAQSSAWMNYIIGGVSGKEIPSKDMQNTALRTVVHPNKDGQKGDIHSFIMIWSEKRKF